MDKDKIKEIDFVLIFMFAKFWDCNPKSADIFVVLGQECIEYKNNVIDPNRIAVCKNLKYYKSTPNKATRPEL